MDRLIIRDLRVAARVGVTAEERERPQFLLVSLEIGVDLSKPGATDELAHTVDYDATAKAVHTLVGSTEAKLLEHVAERVAVHVLEKNEVEFVVVEIAKERLPMEEDIGRIAVRVERATGK